MLSLIILAIEEAKAPFGQLTADIAKAGAGAEELDPWPSTPPASTWKSTSTRVCALLAQTGDQGGDGGRARGYSHARPRLASLSGYLLLESPRGTALSMSRFAGYL